MENNNKIHIDPSLAKRLIAVQFPKWADLPIKPVENGGWDNKTFHLGDKMSIRLPSAKQYSEQAEKEHSFLPKLAPHLPLPIPTPIAMGKPSKEYPWHFSIYEWLEGKTASIENVADMNQFAIALAKFLLALYQIDGRGGPEAGLHNFYRGGSLKIYDSMTKDALRILGSKIDGDAALDIWNKAIASTWKKPPVWVHGDIAPDNLLVTKGKLSAVIDFGCLAIGDPACDLAIAWTFFKDESRHAFKKTLPLDDNTWERGKGWALWKALIVCAGLTNPIDVEKSWLTLNEILTDKKRHSLKKKRI